MKNGRKIGSNFERIAARWLGGIVGTEFRRTQQYNGAGAIGDIEAVNENAPAAILHVECKGGEAVKIGTKAFDAAWEQAKRDCPPHRVPCVIHRERVGLYVFTASYRGIRVHVTDQHFVGLLVEAIIDDHRRGNQ